MEARSVHEGSREAAAAVALVFRKFRREYIWYRSSYSSPYASDRRAILHHKKTIIQSIDKMPDSGDIKTRYKDVSPPWAMFCIRTPTETGPLLGVTCFSCLLSVVLH